jgi:toxin ParE1/3/4
MRQRRLVYRRFVPDDLNAIVDYIRQRDPKSAARFIDGFQSIRSDLRKHPGRGSPKYFKDAELDGLHFRSWSIPRFKDYLVLYHHNDEAVVVYGVVHGARDIERLLKERL